MSPAAPPGPAAEPQQRPDRIGQRDGQQQQDQRRGRASSNSCSSRQRRAFLRMAASRNSIAAQGTSSYAATTQEVDQDRDQRRAAPQEHPAAGKRPERQTAEQSRAASDMITPTIRASGQPAPTGNWTAPRSSGRSVRISW